MGTRNWLLVLPRLVQPEGSLGSGWGEPGHGDATHARGAHPSQVGEQVQAVHPAGRRDRQLGAMARW